MNRESSINKKCVWFFGRGASIAHGLAWEEPSDCASLDRSERTTRIGNALREEMEKISVGKGPYHQLLCWLAERPGWKHSFITTNWDFLLQREVDHYIKTHCPGICPGWLLNSHVFHLNGSVEDAAQGNRPKILFPEDSIEERRNSSEGNQAWNYLAPSKLIIVVGLSFSYPIDQVLLRWLHTKEDWLPYGEARWVILNSNQTSLEKVTDEFKKALPRAQIISLHKDFTGWVQEGGADYFS